MELDCNVCFGLRPPWLLCWCCVKVHWSYVQCMYVHTWSVGLRDSDPGLWDSVNLVCGTPCPGLSDSVFWSIGFLGVLLCRNPCPDLSDSVLTVCGTPCPGLSDSVFWSVGLSVLVSQTPCPGLSDSVSWSLRLRVLVCRVSWCSALSDSVSWSVGFRGVQSM